MSLRDGTAKMSKSDPSDMSRINLTDDADTIMQKVKKAKTDPEPLPSEAARPGGPARGSQSGRHLCGDGRHRSPMPCWRDFAGKGFGAFKPALGELLVETLSPITARFVELRQDREALDAILREGCAEGQGHRRAHARCRL